MRDHLNRSRATVDGRNFASNMSRRKQTSYQQSPPYPQFQCCRVWERRAAQWYFEKRKFRKCDAKRMPSTLKSGERGLADRPPDGGQYHATRESREVVFNLRNFFRQLTECLKVWLCCRRLWLLILSPGCIRESMLDGVVGLQALIQEMLPQAVLLPLPIRPCARFRRNGQSL